MLQLKPALTYPDQMNLKNAKKLPAEYSAGKILG